MYSRRRHHSRPAQPKPSDSNPGGICPGRDLEAGVQRNRASQVQRLQSRVLRVICGRPHRQGQGAYLDGQLRPDDPVGQDRAFDADA